MSRLAVILLLCCFWCAHWHVEAGEPLVWKKMPYMHYSVNEPLSVFLRNILNDQGIQSEISTEISDTINGFFKTEDPEQLFFEMVFKYDLNWYYDGIKLQINRQSEFQEHVIYLTTITSEEFVAHLQKLGVYSDKFVSVVSDFSISLYAPKHYVQKIQDIVNRVDARSNIGVTVIPLKHAWAEDKKMSVRGHDFIIPGVVTILNKLIADSKVGLSGKSGSEKNKKKDNGLDLSGNISAYSRLNAVVVRDFANNFSLWRYIISLLDKPEPLVEISVSIIDVVVDDSSSTGVSWIVGDYKKTKGDKLKVSNNLDDEGNENSDYGLSGSINFSGAFLSGAIPTVTLNDVFARISVLAKKGKGKVVSRSKILGTSNLESIIDYSQTMHVKVGHPNSGVSNVTPITVGVLLRVTPQVIEDKNGTSVKLMIDIEDGSISDKTYLQVDSIPRISKTTIGTQATIDVGETLVIAGYYRDQISTKKRGIPFLSDIPIIGKLFGTTFVSKEKLQRVFMITPSIVGSYKKDSNSKEKIMRLLNDKLVLKPKK